MKFEKEITVEINTSLKNLESLLKENNFKIKEIYDINDIYLLNKNIEKSNNILELLKNCVLIRHIIEKNKEYKMITYKYKEYNDKNEITKQGKINCYIDSIDEAEQLFKYLNYEKLLEIYDHSFVYSNGEDEFVVQCVNNKHIYIEVEDKCHYIDKEYKNIEEMKKVINKYNIPIKSNDYFVKKAEVEMLEKNQIN